MTESNFQKALYDALVPEYEMAMQDVADEHEFSPEFEKKMKKLINRRSKPYYKIINTARKRIACVAVVILAASLVTIMNVDALRNPLSDFFISIFEKFSIFQPVEDDTAPEAIEEIYEITYDLDDFEVIYEDKDKFSYEISYLKDDIVINFTQHIKDSAFNVNTENAEISTIDINGHEAIYFIDNQNYSYLIWDNGDYIISVSSNVGENILIDMAKSVQKAE